MMLGSMTSLHLMHKTNWVSSLEEWCFVRKNCQNQTTCPYVYPEAPLLCIIFNLRQWEHVEEYLCYKLFKEFLFIYFIYSIY